MVTMLRQGEQVSTARRAAMSDSTMGGVAGRGYAKQVQDHFVHPRNVGVFEPGLQGIGSAMVGEASQGGVILMQIRVDQSGMIIDSRFKAYGCAATIAVASWVSEWVKGKSLQNAARLSSVELIDALSLPPVKTHCAMLAEDAIRAACYDYTQKQE